MSLSEPLYEKLTFLVRVVEKEIKHLKYSSNKIFVAPLTLEHIKTIESNSDFAEQLEAYTSRFCRFTRHFRR